MTSLYPLKFRPILKDKIWGGNKIKSELNKDFAPLPNCGESWEISGVPGNISVVAEGALAGKSLEELIRTYQGRLLGDRIYHQHRHQFPLLIKFIDANDDLSIQVHPDDELAMERHDSLGKTEMWYVVKSDPGAKIITGFNQSVDRKEFRKYFENDQLMEILNEEDASAGDVFYIPAGRVHTLGKGNLIAEIQQTSDVTYRIFDFNRVDDQGNSRDLHVEEALDAMDYQVYDDYKTKYVPIKNEVSPLVKSRYFETSLLYLDQPLSRNYDLLDSFKILICIEGSFNLMYEGKSFHFGLGDSVLVPAEISSLEIQPVDTVKIIETYIPQ